jgi:hypothetical protein
MQNLLHLVAIAEFAFLVGNVIAWRRTSLWAREMQWCNQTLAAALELASQGRFDEARTAAESWKGRMKIWNDTHVWAQNKHGEIVYYPQWRRWFGLKP